MPEFFDSDQTPENQPKPAGEEKPFTLKFRKSFKRAVEEMLKQKSITLGDGKAALLLTGNGASKKQLLKNALEEKVMKQSTYDLGAVIQHIDLHEHGKPFEAAAMLLNKGALPGNKDMGDKESKPSPAMTQEEIAKITDREEALALVKKEGRMGLPYAHLSEELRSDPEIALESLELMNSTVQYMPPALGSNLELMRKALAASSMAYNIADETVRADKEAMLALVGGYGNALGKLNREMRDDYDIALAAVQSSPGAINHVSTRLLDDKKFGLAAMEVRADLFSYLSPALRSDADVALMAVSREPGLFPSLGAEAKGDRKIALAAIEAGGKNILSHASDALKGDREVVMAAAQRGGKVLLCASEELCRDREVVLLAAQKSGEGMNRVSEELRDDREVMLAAVRSYGRALQHASERLRDDEELASAALDYTYASFVYASDRLRDDRAFARKAIVMDAGQLAYAGDAVRDDRDIVLLAMEKYKPALKWASERLRGDMELVRMAAEGGGGEVLEYAAPAVRNDRDFVKERMEKNPAAVKYIGEELKDDIAFAEELTSASPRALLHLSDRLRNDRGFVEGIVARHWAASEYAGEKLRQDEGFRDFARQQREAQLGTMTRAVNFLWLNLDLPAKPDPEDGSIVMPMPEEYINNVRDAGARHPDADFNLWVDSRRLTERQLAYLKAVAEADMPNVHVKDLCDIPAYRDEELYSRTETKQNWRSGYNGVVWLQVDAAKILISLQGDYDQKYFADLDHAHLDIDSGRVQGMIGQYGLLIGGSSEHEGAGFENQLWGFGRGRQAFFEEYYRDGLKMSYEGSIAYNALSPHISDKLLNGEHLKTADICLPIGSIGLAHAVHPGHEWSDAEGEKGRSSVSADELTEIFNARSKRGAPAVAAPAAAPVARQAAPAL